MKNFRCFTAILLIATMFVSFNACSSDDDEDDKKEESLIVGKWENTNPDYKGEILEYKSNGTWVYYYDDEYNEKGYYKIESGMLYERQDDSKQWMMFKIDLLNSVSLIIDECDENGKPYGHKESYQRIK